MKKKKKKLPKKRAFVSTIEYFCNIAQVESTWRCTTNEIKTA
jgi:hypothetical protein